MGFLIIIIFFYCISTICVGDMHGPSQSEISIYCESIFTVMETTKELYEVKFFHDI